MEIIQEKELLELSKRINSEWKDVARYLTIKDEQIYRIEQDNPTRTQEQIYQMLLFWKREKGGGATYSVLAQALRQAQRNDLADDLSSRKGFKRFILDVASIFTLAIALQLATVYSLPNADADEISKHVDPGWMLLEILRQKGEITPTYISSLTDALDRIGCHDTVAAVEDSFKRNVSVNLSPPGDYLAPEDDTRRSFADKRKEFLTQLKSNYEDLYDAVQPIPYIRDRLYCVDTVFVEGGIEYLVSVAKIGGRGTWVALETYQNILNDPRVKSVRRIVEGEPGYGKSTLTLQLAYDWCNKIKDSSLRNVDVLILLRLRQLGGVTSIYKAIKQFLLPYDSNLTEEDIKTIISKSSSTVVVLDGFDEYPDQDSRDSDVIKIIKKKMFQQFDVILTTRSSYLPKQYPPQTKRIKLTGFDDNARDQYIRKAVVGNDKEAAEKIKRKLQENAVLAGLCQVPLFFVLFAHMSHESDQFQKFKSVTSFFRYMISCFHSHLKNKMKDDNVQTYELFETDHKHLDKIAFQGLNAKDQKIVWKKQELCERLGQNFYDQYVKLGILIEEDVLAINDNPSGLVSSHIQYETEVRFYHKLFCEWYAAHYLAEYASKEDVTFDLCGGPLGGREPYLNFDEYKNDSLFPSEHLSHVESEELIDGGPFSPPSNIRLTKDSDVKTKEHFLRNLDPLDLQYLYRFTCGLNSVAGEKIIQYLRGHMDGETFAILCILEQEGQVENLLETVQELCSNEVWITSEDNLLLQRSTIQLLEIASSNEMPISSVVLYRCFQSVDLKEQCLCISSDLQLPKLDTLQELEIQIEPLKDLRDHARDILDYSARCVGLKSLK